MESNREDSNARKVVKVDDPFQFLTLLIKKICSISFFTIEMVLSYILKSQDLTVNIGGT